MSTRAVDERTGRFPSIAQAEIGERPKGHYLPTAPIAVKRRFYSED